MLYLLCLKLWASRSLEQLIGGYMMHLDDFLSLHLTFNPRHVFITPHAERLGKFRLAIEWAANVFIKHVCYAFFIRVFNRPNDTFLEHHHVLEHILAILQLLPATLR